MINTATVPEVNAAGAMLPLSITPIATNADGLLGAANMTLIHAGKSTVIYDANTGAPLFSTDTTGFGPALLKITIN